MAALNDANQHASMPSYFLVPMHWPGSASPFFHSTFIFLAQEKLTWKMNWKLQQATMEIGMLSLVYLYNANVRMRISLRCLFFIAYIFLFFGVVFSFSNEFLPMQYLKENRRKIAKKELMCLNLPSSMHAHSSQLKRFVCAHVCMFELASCEIQH
jgi:hypothetical protein